MANETYSDATPDANIASDDSVIAAAQSQVGQDAWVEQATPNATVVWDGTPTSYVWLDQHEKDQETVAMDDLVVQERQRQIDLVTNVYGTANSSDLTAAKEALAAAEEQKNADEKMP